MALLDIYDSYSKQIKSFNEGVEPGSVKLYVCGVTVYDHCHVGHGRVFIVTDLMQRFFKSKGLECFFIRNITDIDDKIINKAKAENRPWHALAEEYTLSMQELCRDLCCLPVQAEPKATQSIPQMIAMIERLIEKKSAYVIDSEVFFSVDSFARYGCLSGQDLDALQAGHRVDVDAHKRNPGDFTLWKPSKSDEPGWDSPWGFGRPGWHIECSAMVTDYCHSSLDFHLGGMDLKFPHHENEIAQSEACHDHPLANCWVHIGFVTVDGEKMSKSLYNFKYLKGTLEAIGPAALRYFYLSTHYRQPLAFTEEKIQDAKNSVQSLMKQLHTARSQDVGLFTESDFETIRQSLEQALSQDLNTPEALVVLHKAVHQIKGAHFVEKLIGLVDALLGLNLTFVDDNPWVPLQSMPIEIAEMAQRRLTARGLKDYYAADQIRKDLLELGYELQDSPQGTLIRFYR
ncbi:MAG: cysteine--tRNA ligase [Gammaproteobacteria bacterium]|nr:cysteine--tRNA ligase [Gammaproteobacteria bacterium]